MTPRRPDGLDPRSYEARRSGKSPMISVTLSRVALDRLDALRGSLSRGVMIAMLIEYWDSKGGKRRRRAPPPPVGKKGAVGGG